MASVNPEELVVRRLDGANVQGMAVVSRIVTNTFFTCIDEAKTAIAEVEPEAVVMMGGLSGRAMVTVERIAQNLNDGTRYGVTDNTGWAV
ncbi:MAG: hypothetical protein GDA49_07230 [Rhodospirillales bacterium]|nr:hypothetical protein [Rhodospirillales bacterium]